MTYLLKVTNVLQNGKNIFDIKKYKKYFKYTGLIN